MVPDRKITSNNHMSDSGTSMRPCSESRGWVISSLSSRKLAVSRNAPAVRDPNTRHAQLALSDGLIGRHGSLDTSPDAYRARPPSSRRTSKSRRLRRSSSTTRSLACPSPSFQL